jgi:hypothetical protein
MLLLTLNFPLHEFMAEGMTVIPCPPYSSVLSPCDFFLFQKLNLVLKVRRLDDIITIQEQLQAELSKFETQGFFQQWFSCWTCCLKLQENYSERDSMK